jgi:hypothetical protein
MKRGALVLAVAAMFAASGCSSFHKEWKAAMNSATPPSAIEGPWAGQWHSDANGHHGSLRCVLTKTSDATYRAHFRAHYKKILRFTYVATLNGHETNGAVKLEGEANLPKWAGGAYKYEGTASATDFHSSYTSKYDHGDYQLTRPSRK